jgi:hypothetical protein
MRNFEALVADLIDRSDDPNFLVAADGDASSSAQ